MPEIQAGDLLWQPTPHDIDNANLTRYRRWLFEQRGLRFDDTDALWLWSVSDLPAFWASIWDYFEIKASQQPESILTNASMPGAQWFPGAKLNYAENILARATARQPMLVYATEGTAPVEVSWATAEAASARLAGQLRALGVGPGDRVAAYLPNTPEAVFALLAVARLGAIWSVCAPDFGVQSVLDRFTQIEPKALIAMSSYRYGGRLHDRSAVIAQIEAALPSLQGVIHISRETSESDAVAFEAGDRAHQSPVTAPAFDRFIQVDFAHPLWILYSSGTTGLPKPIVQSHGGILLEHAKSTALHSNLSAHDRFFWFSSTGWMMWNYLVGALLTGCTIVLYDGSPGYPDMNALWALAAQTGVTYFGTSAAFVHACMKAGISPGRDFDLSQIRAIGSTGSPLSTDGFGWIYQNVHPTVALESMSGGTDVCTAFVGGNRTRPIYAGEIQGPALGACVQAFDEAGQPVVDEVGELVLTAPMPSMPIGFWNDPDGARYRASYFDVYPGVWRHGDWIKINARGGCVIYGRSDATINRQGVRMGTSEIYRAVESIPEIVDSLVIDLELLGRESFMPLFVVLRDGIMLDEGLRTQVRQTLKRDVSPRHVPDQIYQIVQIPYTLSGKKMEVPIRRILLGHAIDKAVSPGSMRNPEALAWFVELAATLNKGNG
jgi:acetoacetyl-CoA synthetase